MPAEISHSGLLCVLNYFHGWVFLTQLEKYPGKKAFCIKWLEAKHSRPSDVRTIEFKKDALSLDKCPAMSTGYIKVSKACVGALLIFSLQTVLVHVNVSSPLSPRLRCLGWMLSF